LFLKDASKEIFVKMIYKWAISLYILSEYTLAKGHQMKKINAVLLLIAPISVILCIFISGCTDDTSNVSDHSVVIEGKEDIYSTITDAINNAVNGDTLLVGAGLYNESLIINKSITLVGDGKETTIISGNLTGDVIHISISHVTITGFTIQNAGIEYYSKGTDAGIDIRSDYNTISDNNIISNGNYGLYFHTASNNNTITYNIFSENKYGIYSNNVVFLLWCK
jgi:nitrous oxidase accessory protein NosD